MVREPTEQERLLFCTLALVVIVAAFVAIGKLMAGGV